jgi:hypothetical protein
MIGCGIAPTSRGRASEVVMIKSIGLGLVS